MKETEDFNAGNTLLDLWIDAIEEADEEGRPRPSFNDFTTTTEASLRDE